MTRPLLILALATAAGAQVSDGGRLDTGVRLPCADCGASVYGGASHKIAGGTRANHRRGPGDDPLHQDRSGWWKSHLGDTALHAAATSADIATSYGRIELNPMYRSPNGQFGGRGVAVHLARFAAIEGAKWWLLRNPQRRNSKLVRWMSRGPALSLGITAARNGVVR